MFAERPAPGKAGFGALSRKCFAFLSQLLNKGLEESVVYCVMFDLFVFANGGWPLGPTQSMIHRAISIQILSIFMIAAGGRVEQTF